jgi:peptidoglycan biosynthesis protein MviN/MurJ (putative lipid II flippase)
MFPLKVGGIALASAISGTVDFLILFFIMDKRLGGMNGGLLEYFLKVICASALTGIVEYWLWNNVYFMPETIKLFVIGGFGFVFYWMVCLKMKIIQEHKILDWFKGQLPDEDRA